MIIRSIVNQDVDIFQFHSRCFAYVTIKDRLPTILVKTLDAFHRNWLSFIKRNQINDSNDWKDAGDESKKIIGEMAKLKYEMVTDKPLDKLIGNATDIDIWNDYFQEYIKKHREEPTWFTAPWLYVECFMYRKLSTFFETSKWFKKYDPFEEQKQHALQSSMSAVVILGNYLALITGNTQEEAIKFVDMFIQISLWGNKCDLSISAGNDNSQITSPLKDLVNLKEKILVNDSEKLLDFFTKLKADKQQVILDIVLDNAGFELFTDLCLIEVLYLTGFLDLKHSLVRFYVKKHPWFISDTMKHDFYSLLDYMKNYHESNIIKDLGGKWHNYLANKQWILIENDYWTLPHDFSAMKIVNPDLYNQIGQANLVIFKGDLNYRKLAGDLNWIIQTPFREALRGFLPTSLCSLRTIKANVACGFPIDFKQENYPKDWMVSGEFGMIHLVKKE